MHPEQTSVGFVRQVCLVGGTASTEITFRLPGVRIEHIQTETNTLVNLTAVTPLSETEVNHCIYWTVTLRWRS